MESAAPVLSRRHEVGAGSARGLLFTLLGEFVLPSEGAAGTSAVLAALPAALPRADNIHLDAGVLLFTLGMSVLAGTMFGLAPALRTARPNVAGTLKEGGRGGSGTRHRMQNVFVVIEMALSLVLLVGAGLMIRTLAALGKDRVMFAADYPFESAQEAGEFLDHVSLAEPLRQDIAFGNAAKYLGLPQA